MGPNMSLRTWFAVAGVLAFSTECGLASAAEKERTIYTKDTLYTTILVKEDRHGLRTLWFRGDDEPQSAGKVDDPDHIAFEYVQAMPVALALVKEPKRVLVVGLGGGTLPNLLHKHYPQMVIDTVDIDPDVVDAAKRFFGFRADTTMHAYVGDGRQFIEECKVPYDIVFLDAYGSEDIPYHMATKEFLQAVRRATAPNGIVASNIWAAGANRLHDPMVRTFQEVFDSVYIVAVKEDPNEIILALPTKTVVARAELARLSSQLSKDQKLRFDIGAYVRSGFRNSSPKTRAARVLLDQDKRASPPQ